MDNDALSDVSFTNISSQSAASCCSPAKPQAWLPGWSWPEVIFCMPCLSTGVPTTSPEPAPLPKGSGVKRPGRQHCQKLESVQPTLNTCCAGNQGVRKDKNSLPLKGFMGWWRKRSSVTRANVYRVAVCRALLHILIQFFFMLYYEETKLREVSNLSRVTAKKQQSRIWTQATWLQPSGLKAQALLNQKPRQRMAGSRGEGCGENLGGR